MKQIKGIFLFLMSVVLVAFGSQDSKNSKGLVKKLEDRTKEVGKSIVGKKNKAVKADNKKEVAKKEENKKVEQKPAQPQPQPVQQSAPAAAVQPQPQPQQNTVSNNPNSAQNKAINPEYALDANNKTSGKKGSKKYKKSNQYSFYKEPKHSRLKNNSSSSHKSSHVKSQDSSAKPASGGNSGGSSSSGGTSTGGGDSSSSE